MNIILFGPPGAGKGTQAKYLVAKLNSFQISTGDMLRNEIQNDTEIGKMIINDMNEGKFISDEYPDGKQPFPLNGPITDENYYDNNLKISITADTIDTNVFNDKSGNNNYGFNFSDYKPQFNQKTLKPQKVKFIGNKNSSKFGGPF